MFTFHRQRRLPCWEPSKGGTESLILSVVGMERQIAHIRYAVVKGLHCDGVSFGTIGSENVGEKAPGVIREMAIGEEPSESFGTFLAVVGEVRIVALFDFFVCCNHDEMFLRVMCRGTLNFTNIPKHGR